MRGGTSVETFDGLDLIGLDDGISTLGGAEAIVTGLRLQFRLGFAYPMASIRGGDAVLMRLAGGQQDADECGD